jgi:succinate dehydrogenase / fumarate reductase cytochrome b subunit
MSWFLNFYRSAIGKKSLMALTGIILFGFVLVHMIGNLKLYMPDHDGEKAINVYGEFLRHMGDPLIPAHSALWIARIVLMAAVLLHIIAAWQLTLMNRKARPVDYGQRDSVAASYASRTMRWGGVLILLFVIYHILHFTTGDVHGNFIPGDVHHNMVMGFSVWWVSAIYIIANIALGFHLYHGLWSMFQSLGLNHSRFNSWRRNFATAFAWIVTIGNISFPVAVLTGLVR